MRRFVLEAFKQSRGENTVLTADVYAFVEVSEYGAEERSIPSNHNDKVGRIEGREGGAS